MSALTFDARALTCPHERETGDRPFRAGGLPCAAARGRDLPRVDFAHLVKALDGVAVHRR